MPATPDGAVDPKKVIVAPIYFGPKSVKARVTRRQGMSNMNASEKVQAMCAEFTYKSLRPIEPVITEMCTSALTHNYVPEKAHAQIEVAVDRIHNFLRALEHAMAEGEAIPTLTLPPRPREEGLEHAARWSEDEERRRRARLATIERKKRELDDERAKLDALERKMAEERARIEAERAKVTAELSLVKPQLDAALEGLAAIKDEHLWEVRSYMTPPPMVHKVLSSVLTVLGKPGADKWDVIQGQMKQKDFIPSIRDFDVNSVDPTRLVPLRRFIDDPNFTHENAQHASKAAAPLRVWVIALTKYTEVYSRIKPLLDELDRDRDVTLRPMEAEAAAIRNKLMQLEREVANMQAAYNRIFDEAELRERDRDKLDAIDARNAKRFGKWQERCDVLRARHDAIVHKILNKPPEIDDEARRVAAVVRKRCEEVLKCVEHSFGRVKQPATGEPELIAKVAGAPVDTSVTRRATSSPRQQQGRAGSPAQQRQPWHVRLFASSSPSRGRDASQRRLAESPSRRVSTPAARGSSPARRGPSSAGKRAGTPPGTSPAPRPPWLGAGSPARSNSPARRPAAGSPQRTASSPGRSSANKPSSPNTARQPREQKSASNSRHPLCRPEPGSTYRGTAVERYYLAVNLRQTMSSVANDLNKRQNNAASADRHQRGATPPRSSATSRQGQSPATLSTGKTETAAWSSPTSAVNMPALEDRPSDGGLRTYEMN